MHIEAALRVVLLFAPVADAAPLSSQNARTILQTAVDAQLTRESTWERGAMVVSVSQTGVNSMSAQLEVAWDGVKKYVDVQQLKQQSVSVSGAVNEEVVRPYRKCLSPNTEWSYFPSQAVVYGRGTGRLGGLPKSLDVFPRQSLGAVPLIPQIRLTDSMGHAASKGALTGVRLDSGLIQITTNTRRYVVDSAADLAIVRIENEVGDLSKSRPSLASPLVFVAEYTWERDQHGVLYCKDYRLEAFKDDAPDQLAFVREIHVTEYDSQPDGHWQRFDLDSLDVPKGTLVKYSDENGPRSWRYGIRGSEAQGLQQPDFDRLIKQLKQKGFAAPK